jgi:hypothetical protein
MAFKWPKDGPKGTPLEVMYPKEPPIVWLVTALVVGGFAIWNGICGDWWGLGIPGVIAVASGLKFARWCRDWWRFRG